MGICGFSWRFSLLLVSGGNGCWCTSDEAGCLGLTTRNADASATPRLEKSNGPTPTGECCCCTSIILDFESVHRFTTLASLHTTFASPSPTRLQSLSFLSNKQTYTILPNLISNEIIQSPFNAVGRSVSRFLQILENLRLQKQRFLDDYRDRLFDNSSRKRCLFLISFLMCATPSVFDKILSQDYLFADFILLRIVNISW